MENLLKRIQFICNLRTLINLNNKKYKNKKCINPLGGPDSIFSSKYEGTKKIIKSGLEKVKWEKGK